MTNAIYILSAGRSGSTLLNLILGSHSRAVAVGEVTLLPKHLELNSRCTCERPIRDCELWSTALGELSRAAGADPSRSPSSLDLGFMGNRRLAKDPRTYGRYRMLWKLRHAPIYSHLRFGLPLPQAMRSHFDASIEARLDVYAAIRNASGKPVVVDSSKAYLPGISVYKKAADRTRLILLTRDGRASFFSRLRGNYGTREECMRAWRDYYQHALPLLDRNVASRHTLHVRYEDLAVLPEKTIRSICEFAEMDYEAGMLDFRAATHHVVGGNNMRFRSENAIKLDTAWESGLSDDDKRYFEAAAGALNRKLGYA